MHVRLAHQCDAEDGLLLAQDVDGYKSTTYYETVGKNETGFGITGMNTSSSVGDIHAMNEQ